MKGAKILLVAGLSAATLCGCRQPYVPPTAGEPHAILKFRRTYDAVAGTTLREVLLIDERSAYAESVPSRRGKVPRTDSLLAHPGPVALQLRSNFFHSESYTTTESYSCGTTDSPRTCSRTVSRTRTVSDGACRQELGVQLDAGKSYLLSLTYQDRRNCRASCLIQEPLGEGKFKNRPCVLVAIED